MGEMAHGTSTLSRSITLMHPDIAPPEVGPRAMLMLLLHNGCSRRAPSPVQHSTVFLQLLQMLVDLL